MENSMVSSSVCRTCNLSVVPSVSRVIEELQFAHKDVPPAAQGLGVLEPLRTAHRYAYRVGTLESVIEYSLRSLRGFCSDDCEEQARAEGEGTDVSFGPQALRTLSGLAKWSMCNSKTTGIAVGPGFGPFKLTNGGDNPVDIMKLEIGSGLGVVVVTPSPATIPASERVRVRDAIVEGLGELVDGDGLSDQWFTPLANAREVSE